MLSAVAFARHVRSEHLSISKEEFEIEKSRALLEAEEHLRYVYYFDVEPCFYFYFISRVDVERGMTTTENARKLGKFRVGDGPSTVVDGEFEVAVVQTAYTAKLVAMTSASVLEPGGGDLQMQKADQHQLLRSSADAIPADYVSPLRSLHIQLRPMVNCKAIDHHGAGNEIIGVTPVAKLDASNITEAHQRLQVAVSQLQQLMLDIL